MANPKKRKETASQPSTLLDFFGKEKVSSDSTHRELKKAKTKTAPSARSVSRVKRESTDDVIVIDSSDDDDIVEVSSIRPAPKPLQPKAEIPLENELQLSGGNEARSRSPVLRDLSASALSFTLGLHSNCTAEGPNVKSEQESCESVFGLPSELLVPSSSTASGNGREPSPFGCPSMLLTQDEQKPSVDSFSSMPAVPTECSHDVLQNGLPPAPLEGLDDAGTSEALLGEGDWDMGDDEMNLIEGEPSAEDAIDEQSVDIDLTLDDDASGVKQEQPVEICPICEKQLEGMSSMVRPSDL